MKKAASIVFQLNFRHLDEKGIGKVNRRFVTLYRQLRRSRHLAQFCRDAFIEKARRHLNGLEISYQQLDSFIKSNGVPYILDSIREKETQMARSSVNAADNDDNPHLIALVKGMPDEPPNKKIDMEKLRGLL